MFSRTVAEWLLAGDGGGMSQGLEAYYSAQELAGLAGMPETKSGVIRAAKRENWLHRTRTGKGGGREYAESALPKATQKALLIQRAVAKLKAEQQALAPVDAAALPVVLQEYEITDWQRNQRDARQGVCHAVSTLLAASKISQKQAVHIVIGTAIKEGEGSHEYRQLVLARDGRGLKNAQGEQDLPSPRTVERWLDAGDLTPKKRLKDLQEPIWAADFLACYRQPQKISVEAAYADFCRHHGHDRPSIHQVRRYLKKLPKIVQEKGRMGPRELKNIKPFVRRTFEQLWPNDVWSADGHCFDAEVQHPFHGQPFRPEITSIIDIGTRLIVGFSVSLAESSLATVDALRYAITQHGIPAIFYVDNGSGYANEMLENAATGLLSRLGITVKHSLPYNSQARGVIERLHKSVWIPAAKTLPSYIGADMDREAGNNNHKLTRRGDKNGIVQLPISWQAFITLCEDSIAAYNRRPHSSLPKYANAEGKRRHYSPADYWAYKAETLDGYEAVTIEDEVAETLFRPRDIRTVARGEINIFSKKYFASELAGHHGDNLQVAYDIHDYQFIWVYSGEGDFICKAEYNGNAKDYFEKSVIEMGRDKRRDDKAKRLQVKIDRNDAERHGAPALEALPVNEIPGMRPFARKLEEKQPVEMAATIPQEDRERYQFWRDLDQRAQAGESPPESLQPFYRSFPNTAVWRSWNSFYNESTTGQERSVKQRESQ